MELVSIGSDPELLLVDRHSGKFISAIGRIGGSKHMPRPTTHGSVQEDGVAAEFNIKPAATLPELKQNFKDMFSDINEILTDFPDLVISNEVYAVFDTDQLLDPAAREAGCDPDFDAWAKAENEAPNFGTTNERCVGGHIHIGAKFTDMHDQAQFIRALDLMLAVPATMVEDVRRRKLYGKAGAFRPKEYGVEYRTLSNFWIFKDEYITWVYETVERALKEYKDLDLPEARIKECINNGDKNLARELMETFKLNPVPEV